MKRSNAEQPVWANYRISRNCVYNRCLDATPFTTNRQMKSFARFGLLIVFVLLLGRTVFAVPTHIDIPGALQGRSSVTSSGRAQYTIPIDIPPGVAGMQPQVALTYNSGQRNGTAGVGWSLSAGQQIIHRCNHTIAQGEMTKGIEHTSDDRLCLNGQRLVFVSGTGQYGSDDTFYRTEVASLQKIEAIGSGAVVTRFEVSNRDGMKYTFGLVPGAGAPDGRIETVGAPLRRDFGRSAGFWILMGIIWITGMWRTAQPVNTIWTQLTTRGPVLTLRVTR